MGSTRLRWLATVVTVTALGMTGGGIAHAAPTPSPTPPTSAATPGVTTPSPGSETSPDKQVSSATPSQTSTTPAKSPSTASSPSATTRSAKVAPKAASQAATTRAATFKPYLVYATRAVTARAGIGPATKAYGNIPYGGHVSTRDAGNGTANSRGWTAVIYKGTKAWIQTGYLSRTKPPAFKPYLVYATRTVTARAGIGLGTKAYGSFGYGGHVSTRDAGNGTANSRGWTAVTYKGKKAWIQTGYLSRTKPRFKPYLVYATRTVTARAGIGPATKAYGSFGYGGHVSTRDAGNGTANSRGWTAVIYKGKNAWIQTGYLSRTKPPAVRIDSRCMSGKVICISKKDRKLRLVQDGKILITLDARFGSEEGPTREGTFKVEWRDKNWVSTIYGSKMPYAMFFSGGEAIHYSSDFAARGYNGNSHGCVNIRSWSGIQYVWNHTSVGTKVVVYK